MARHQGRGMASINYPIGMNLGGDPSQALMHSNPDGKFTVALSAIDLGQGMKQVSGRSRPKRWACRSRTSMSTPPTATPARTTWAPSRRAARIALATR